MLACFTCGSAIEPGEQCPRTVHYGDRGRVTHVRVLPHCAACNESLEAEQAKYAQANRDEEAVMEWLAKHFSVSERRLLWEHARHAAGLPPLP